MGKNILLTIAYDGSAFHGWQKQPDEFTVQGHLERVMTGLFKREILLNGTSRTDAGVHALDQKASFVSDVNIPTDRLARVINNALCGGEKGSFAKAPVRILDAREMPEDFHARFSCKGKKYIYKIKDESDELSMVFDRNYVYHVRERLDTEAMKTAAALLKGTHDFKSFEASGGNPRTTTVRTIFDADITGKDGEMELHISGDGFLYNMVRIITGTLIEIGQGKRSPQEMEKIIAAADRQAAGFTAPPYGLYLAEVYY
ncbi:MAG: tRNA pseudouridine(38-40) synthase TruA [Bacillota bacterium]|nr:tRNA pseudouridine(38-40) synthase TruA [Bacillota bacterium]